MQSSSVRQGAGGRLLPLFLLSLLLVSLPQTSALPLPGGSAPSQGNAAARVETTEVKGWHRQEDTCILRDTSGRSKPASFGPFPALLTLASDGSLLMFEPVHLQVMCPAHPSGLLHVPCLKEEGALREAGTEEGSFKFRRHSHWETDVSGGIRKEEKAAPYTRPVPDLKTPLMLDKPRTSGFLERLVALGMRRMQGQGLLSGASNQVADIYRWLMIQMGDSRPFELDCGDNRRARNPTFSYTHFWGAMLQAYYASKDVTGANIPSFSENL